LVRDLETITFKTVGPIWGLCQGGPRLEEGDGKKKMWNKSVPPEKTEGHSSGGDGDNQWGNKREHQDLNGLRGVFVKGTMARSAGPLVASGPLIGRPGGVCTRLRTTV